MWLFSKKKDTKQKTSSATLSAQVHTMQDDLNALNVLPPLPDTQKTKKSVEVGDQQSSQKRIVEPHKEAVAQDKSPISSGPKTGSLSGPFSSGNTPPLPLSKPASQDIALKPLPSASKDLSPVEAVSQGVPQSAVTVPQANGEYAIPSSPLLSQQGNLKMSLDQSKGGVSSEASSETQETLHHLEKKQQELRTGNWPINETSIPKEVPSENPSEKLQKALLPNEERTVFSGPKQTMASAEHIIIAEEPIGKKITAAIAVIMILAAAGGGAYYFWRTRVEQTPVVFPALEDVLPKRGEVAVEDVKPDYPFLVDKPNNFVIDVETETISTLREKLLENAKTMQDADMTLPVRFVPVDKNNTPIAFFIFASVFNLGLSGDLLNSLGNDFSLYLSLDNGAPRLGLLVSYKDAETLRSQLKASEPTLPISLKNLLLDDAVSPPANAVFGDSSYELVPIRFYNFDTPEPLSVDYAFMRDYLIIGTSKDTTRAMIDEALKL